MLLGRAPEAGRAPSVLFDPHGIYSATGADGFHRLELNFANTIDVAIRLSCGIVWPQGQLLRKYFLILTLLSNKMGNFIAASWPARLQILTRSR